MCLTMRYLLAAALMFEAGVTPSFAATKEGVILKDFESEPAGGSPAGFSFGRTGEGRLGRWIVQKEKDAPNGRQVLAQVDTDSTDYRFPIAVIDEPILKDLKVSVRCKPVSG